MEENTTHFPDFLDLFFVHGAGGVAGENQEGADGALTGVQVFIEVTSFFSILATHIDKDIEE